jgi:hypothetical protein
MFKKLWLNAENSKVPTGILPSEDVKLNITNPRYTSNDNQYRFQ